MPEYLHPGVYIEKIEPGPRPIEGVPTSTAAFLGEAERGSITPRVVNSYKDYQRWFGDVFDPNKLLPYAVNGFFENGGKRMYLCRLVGDGAAPAAATLRELTVPAAGPRPRGARGEGESAAAAPKRGAGGGGAVSPRRPPCGGREPVPDFDPFVERGRLPRPDL